MSKIEMVTAMVENGYCLFDETVEHFADRFTEEMIKSFFNSFMKYKANK